MANDDVVVLCDPAVLSGNSSKLRRSESPKGAVKYRVEVKSEPLVHSFDPRALGAPVANAMAEVLKQRMKAIGAGVSAGTLAWRESYAKGFAKGTPSSRRRYAGGRMGPMAPNQSPRAFNDSGRFAESLKATPADNAWNINVAANRLDERTAGGELGVRRIWNELVRHVPAFGKPLELFNDKQVMEGLAQSLEQMIQKLDETREAVTMAKAKSALALVRQAIQVLLMAA